MKFGALLLSTLMAALLVLGAEALWRGDRAPQAMAQPAFERVTKSRTIRCAYAVWAPYVTVDPTTKKISGFAYDIFEAVGKILNRKVEWTEEISYAQIADNLNTGRNDVMCNTVWPSGNRAASLDFTQAIDFIAAYPFVRVDDARFDGDRAKLNDPSVTVAVLDGDVTQAIPSEDFPRARQLSLSMDSDVSQLFLSVVTKKADVAFIDAMAGYDFEKNNPGQIKRIEGAVRVYGDSYAVAKGETKLRDMINVALWQLNQSGLIRATLDRYLGDHKGHYFYPAQPYEK